MLRFVSVTEGGITWVRTTSSNYFAWAPLYFIVDVYYVYSTGSHQLVRRGGQSTPGHAIKHCRMTFMKHVLPVLISPRGFMNGRLRCHRTN